MPKDRNLLIVIADGEHVRFVRPSSDNALHSEALLTSPTLHQRSADLGSDHPGASMHTGSSAHHALAPRHDPHTLAKETFARFVSEQLNAASDAFRELLIVAPSHILAEIRDALDTKTAAKVIGSLPKDLVKTPDEDLWSHLHEWVRPVHRVIGLA